MAGGSSTPIVWNKRPWHAGATGTVDVEHMYIQVHKFDPHFYNYQPPTP